MSIIIRICI